MTAGKRAYTIVVQRDGALSSRSFRVPVVLVRAAVVLGAVAVVLAVAAVISYAPVARAAARLPGLQREVARLRAENARVLELSAAVDSLEQRYTQVRRMLGADIVPEPVRHTALLPVAPPIRANPTPGVARFAPGASPPRYWPLDEPGFVTRGHVSDGDKDEPHPGIDVAMPMGSIVRASGGGKVVEAGSDPEYGLFVLLDHPDNYQSMYGHLSRLLVAQGDSVYAGDVVGVTGNTGRSTAPHLHFEIRREGVSVDPLSVVKETR